MDLLPGRSLEKEGPMPPDRVARIGLDILGALRVAHAQGVLHRDVKPANIFLRDDGRAVLTDFGLASLEGETPLTQEGHLVGSPSFMAPERVRHEPSGPASDLWSLGATLYALTEGRTPFSRATVMGTLGAVLTEEPARPQAAGPLGPLIMAMLVKDPAARLNADQIERALHSFTTGEPTLPASPLPQIPQGGPVGRHPTVPSVQPRKSNRAWGIAATLTGALLLVTVAAIVIATQLDEEPPKQRRPVAVTTAPARFSAPPSPCGLITAEQAGRLVRSFFTSDSADEDEPEKSCTWSTSPTGNDSIDETLRLTLRTTSDSNAAAQYFAEQHGDNTGATAVQDLGDAAYAYTTPSGTGPANSVVAFRIDNLTAEVSYRTDRGDPSQQTLEAARWVYRSLGTAGQGSPAGATARP
jgi:serine/threonine protein kinase